MISFSYVERLCLSITKLRKLQSSLAQRNVIIRDFCDKSRIGIVEHDVEVLNSVDRL